MGARRKKKSNNTSMSSSRVLLLLVVLVVVATAATSNGAAVQDDGEFAQADKNADSMLTPEEFSSWRQGGNTADFKARALSFWTAFINSVAMIIVTELGDKTFFIAAIMAMR
jgi:ABC-type glycerol-3-phosphate transport system substrate-binding protein